MCICRISKVFDAPWQLTKFNFLTFSRIKTLIKREEEKSKRAETKMGQMLTAKEPEGFFPDFCFVFKISKIILEIWFRDYFKVWLNCNAISH